MRTLTSCTLTQRPFLTHTNCLNHGSLPRGGLKIFQEGESTSVMSTVVQQHIAGHCPRIRY
jgi:hypothetical protein